MLFNGCEEFDVNDEKFSNGFEELIGLEEDGVSGDWKEEIVLGENEERFW